MGLGFMIPSSCSECELLLTCFVVPRWLTAEMKERLEQERMKNCPYNIFVGRNDEGIYGEGGEQNDK